MWRIITYILAFLIGGFLTIAGTESLLHVLMNMRYLSFRMEDVMIFIAGHILFAYIPSSIAGHKGHSYMKWFIYGFCLPPIALIHSILIKDYEKEYKECPYCAERVKKAAKVCRYCGRDIVKDYNNMITKESEEKGVSDL